MEQRRTWKPVLTPAQMRDADEATIAAARRAPSSWTAPRTRARSSPCGCSAARTGSASRSSAGKGNNGGDGIACARHLARPASASTVFLLDEPSGDAAAHLDMTRRCRLRPCPHRTVDADRVRRAAAACRSRRRRDPRHGLRRRAARRRGATRSPRSTRAGEPVLAIDIAVRCLRRRRYGSRRRRARRRDRRDPGAQGRTRRRRPARCTRGRVDVADIGIPVLGAPNVRADGARRARRASRVRGRHAQVPRRRAGRPRRIVRDDRRGDPHGARRDPRGRRARDARRSVEHARRRSRTPSSRRSRCRCPRSKGSSTRRPSTSSPTGSSKCRALAVGPGLGRGPRAVALVRRALDVDLPLVIDGDGLWALGRGA